MKLEYLTPYLPHKLNICETETNRKYELIPYKRQYERLDNKMPLQEFMNFNSKKFKPILRPLSDLTKEIEINEEKFVPIKDDSIKIIEEISKLYDFKAYENMLHAIPYYSIIKLIKWHFDVFGLIPKGLAIDINTLK